MPTGAITGYIADARRPEIAARPQQAVDPLLSARRARDDVCPRSRPAGIPQGAGFQQGDYDFTVFRITSEISRQVFPLHP